MFISNLASVLVGETGKGAFKRTIALMSVFRAHDRERDRVCVWPISGCLRPHTAAAVVLERQLSKLLSSMRTSQEVTMETKETAPTAESGAVSESVSGPVSMLVSLPRMRF